MLAFELCSCHSGNTHKAKALGVFTDVTVTSGAEDIRSEGEEQPAKRLTAKALMSNFTSFPRLSLTRLYHSSMEAPKPRRCGAIQLKVLGCVERKRQL